MRRRSLLLWIGSVALASLGALSIFRIGPIGILAGCPLRTWTGIPCPTCGGIRSIGGLLAGDIGRFFSANPLLALFVSLILMSGVAALVALPWADRLRPPRWPSRRVLVVLVLALVVANWIYLLL